MTIRSDSDIVDITLLPLLSYSGEIGGKPLPTTIPTGVMASAGGDYVIALSDDTVMTLS
jgi:hypothetical protein